MATALQAFTNHEFGTIRTITSDGQILFCGRDVAATLGYANTKDALARHCKGVVNHYPLETAGGIQQVSFISEGDLYRLIVSSKLPAAEQALLEAAPKVSYYNVVLASPSLITTTEIAKDYGLSAKKLNQILREEQVQFHQSGRWFLYARFAEQGYTQFKTHEYDKGVFG